ncbi:MAG: hemolysin family protein [Thermodesulfobacteriota bacterium]
MDIDAPLRFYLLFFLFWGLVFFTLAEAALFGLGRLGLKKLKDTNHPTYPLLERLHSSPRRLIISLLIGNEAMNVAITSLACTLFISFWGEAGKYITIPLVIFTILLFGEVIPKTIGVNYAPKIAPALAAALARYMSFIVPIRWLLESVVNGLMKIFRIRIEFSPSPLTEEVFKELVSSGQKEGSLEAEEKDLIFKVFRFTDQTVKNIMTPREAVFALPITAKMEEVIEALREHRFSRIPVYSGDLDHVTGILYAKDLLRMRRPEGGLRPLLRRAYFIPVSKKLDDLFWEMRKQKIHLAIVVDEFGRLAGVVTLEDLLEELFGEIYDELDLERQRRRKKRERR